MKVLLLCLISSFLMASNFIFIGEEEGKFSAGIESNLAYGAFQLNNRVTLMGVRLEDSMILHSKVKYTIEIVQDNIFYKHYSIHSIDETNFSSSLDIIGIEYRFEKID